MIDPVKCFYCGHQDSKSEMYMDFKGRHFCSKICYDVVNMGGVKYEF